MCSVDSISGDAKKPGLAGAHPGKSFLFFLTTEKAYY